MEKVITKILSVNYSHWTQLYGNTNVPMRLFILPNNLLNLLLYLSFIYYSIRSIFTISFLSTGQNWIVQLKLFRRVCCVKGRGVIPSTLTELFQNFSRIRTIVIGKIGFFPLFYSFFFFLLPLLSFCSDTSISITHLSKWIQLLLPRLKIQSIIIFERAYRSETL